MKVAYVKARLIAQLVTVSLTFAVMIWGMVVGFSSIPNTPLP